MKESFEKTLFFACLRAVHSSVVHGANMGGDATWFPHVFTGLFYIDYSGYKRYTRRRAINEVYAIPTSLT